MSALERSALVLVSIDEAPFVARLIAREEAAFVELVRAYEGRIFALLHRMVGTRAEAEDLAQEVFVQVFKSIEQFRGDAKLGTWLYRIALNLCKNRRAYLGRRHLDPRSSHASTAFDADLHASPQAGPEEDLAGRQLEELVRRAIASLDPELGEALVLRDVEDLPYDEIAQITGVAEGTVKSRLHRARAELRVRVEKAWNQRGSRR